MIKISSPLHITQRNSGYHVDGFTDPNEIYTFDCEASNTRLDSHYSIMANSTLLNYARALNEGTAFLTGHDHQQLPLGRSFRGQATPDLGGLPFQLMATEIGRKNAERMTPMRVTSSIFLLRGYNGGGMNTDEFIRGVEGGIIRDVSVGFSGGEHTCMVCGRDVWRDWNCPHIPGIHYDEKDRPASRLEGAMAISLIENAELAELSAVYSGSNRDAQITKVQRMMADARVDPYIRGMYESEFGVDLSSRKFYSQGRNKMDIEQLLAQIAELRLQNEQVVSAAADKEAALMVRENELQTSLVERDAEILRLRQKEAELSSLADQGRAYRADLIEEALRQGVRAYGNEFAVDTYRTVMETASIEVIKRMSADWKLVGDRTLPNGRMTIEDTSINAGTRKNEETQVPPAAFQ